VYSQLRYNFVHHIDGIMIQGIAYKEYRPTQFMDRQFDLLRHILM